MGNFRTITCEICGQFAQVPARRKLNYCDRPECLKEFKRRKWCEYTNRYMHKRKETENKNKSERIISKKIINYSYPTYIIEPETQEPDLPIAIKSEYREAKEMITKKKVNTDALDSIEIYDIRDIARELGTIRFKLIEMYQKESEQVKKFEKDDLTLLHAFELEDLTKDEVWKMYQETKQRRTNRRGGKDRKILIGTLLNSIQIKNPDKFIVRAVNDGRQNKDFPDVVEELKKDETLFVQPKEKDTE